MKPLVIYHANCTDGFASAWAFSRFYGHDGCDWAATKHGDAPPDVAGREVYLADFAFPRDVLVEMNARAASLRVLDHHKSAAADLVGLDFCTIDLTRSGAGIAWDFLAAREAGAGGAKRPRPWPIDYVEDRDLWRFALPDAEDVCKFLLTLPFDFAAWDALLELTSAKACAELGAAMRDYDKYLIRWTLKGAHRLTIGGYDVPAVNSAVLASELGHTLCIDEPFAAVYVRLADGRLGFSLRSASPAAVDVAAVAALYGGGGHHCAAGFSVASLAALNAVTDGEIS